MYSSLQKLAVYCFCLLFTAIACDSYLGGDVNNDPNKVKETTLSATLPPIITNTAQTYYDLGYYTSQITQNTANYFASGPSIQDLIRLGGAWSNIYLDVLVNAHKLKKQALKQNSPHYAGVAEVLTAMNIGLATDNWGPVPFKQALKGENNLQPVYEPQKKIYMAIQDTLDKAIEHLQAPNSSQTPGDDDLIYGGDMSKWVKLAHAIKARYYIHLTKQQPNKAPQKALNEAGMSFTDNSDNFELTYTSRNFNPYYSNVALSNNTGNFYLTFSEQFINALNGDTYGVFDPLLPLIADNGEDSTYTGLVEGTTSGNNTDFDEQTFYSQQKAPLLMATYSEIKFIEAEARFLLNGGTKTSVGSSQKAYDDYREGIKAHMKEVGVAREKIQKYLNDPRVGVGASKLKLSLIMKEKWIALFLNPESWTDMRRYDYSPEIYKNLSLPMNLNTDLNGKWIRRIAYPLSEINRNGEHVKEVQQDLNVKMWWDKGGVDR